MEGFLKFLNIFKLKFSQFCILLVASSIFLINPFGIISLPKLDAAIDKYLSIIGFTFVISLSSVLIYVAQMGYLFVKQRYEKRVAKNRTKNRIQNLTDDERLFLHRFKEEGKSVIRTPFNDEIALGLIDSGLLTQLGDILTDSYYGRQIAIRLAEGITVPDDNSQDN